MQNIIKHNAETFSEMLISLVLKSLDLANRLKQRPESEKIGPSKSTCFSSIPNRICSKPRWVWGTWCLMVSPFTMTDSHAQDCPGVHTRSSGDRFPFVQCQCKPIHWSLPLRISVQAGCLLDACWMPAGYLDATENQKKSGNKINKNQGPNESHLLLESNLLRVQLFQHIGTFSLRSARS